MVDRASTGTPLCDRGARPRPTSVRFGAQGVVPYAQPGSAAVSAVMRANQGRDTTPELATRRLLHAQGYRYRVHQRVDTPSVWVRPDLVFGCARVAVFIDGCFWHGCPRHGCQRSSDPPQGDWSDPRRLDSQPGGF